MPKNLAETALNDVRPPQQLNEQDVLRGISVASTVTVAERNNSFDGASGTGPLGCRKCCAQPTAEGADQHATTGLRAAAAKLTGWAAEGVQALSKIATGAGSGEHGRGHARRSRQSWMLCVDGDEAETFQASASSRSPDIVSAKRLEELMIELFCLQDLNGNGLLEEDELIKLNEKIAMLHYGKDTDRQIVKDKYRDVFRNELSVDGEAVSYDTFSVYMSDVLDRLDSDKPSQEMILEQFVAEARLGREAFRLVSLSSASDAPWLPTILVPPAGHSRGVGARLDKMATAAMPAVAEDPCEGSTPSHAGSPCKSHATSSTTTSVNEAQ